MLVAPEFCGGGKRLILKLEVRGGYSQGNECQRNKFIEFMALVSPSRLFPDEGASLLQSRGQVPLDQEGSLLLLLAPAQQNADLACRLVAARAGRAGSREKRRSMTAQKLLHLVMVSRHQKQEHIGTILKNQADVQTHPNLKQGWR